MANSILTDVKITRKALQILHNKLAFIGTINRQYDSAFGVQGAKIGASLRIRLPNQYTVRTGPIAATQATQEQYEMLTIATQKGVDMDFTDADLTLSLDDFADRILEPAMSVLTATVESDVLQHVYQNVFQTAGVPGYQTWDLMPWLNAKQALNQALTPRGARAIQMNSAIAGGVVNNLRTLFQDEKSISKQYLEGRMFKTSGFEFYENELTPVHTNGQFTATNARVFGSSQAGISPYNVGSLITNGWTPGDILTPGTVIALVGVAMVHPETKTAYASPQAVAGAGNLNVSWTGVAQTQYLQNFVVQATYDANGNVIVVQADANGKMIIPILPSIVPTGAYQNVSNSPLNGALIYVQGAANGAWAQSLAYHRDFCTFVTADLQMPKGMDMAQRINHDGISLRFLRGFDIINDIFISRFDILYGYAALRPQLCCRVVGATTI